ncbi:Ataxin-1 [Bagarius yarrelli]|uniref:Ataxin-1 n=1 Tax=Bagarius yarrelli TaxID=175774 RepID=A0A556TPR4_BAGYA|nr:Ataxin-1 [Bagarius yarrelli]
MKSNQERSNECLPPKKRELLASTLPSEDRPLVMAPASESQRGGNLAWLASMASGHESSKQRTSSSAEAEAPQCKAAASTVEPTNVLTATSTIPTVYTSILSQQAGTNQYSPMHPNVHFINPSDAAPYNSYISPLVTSAVITTSSSQRHTEAYSGTTNSLASKPDLVISSTDSIPQRHSAQYVQISSSQISVVPCTASSPQSHLPFHLQQTLALSGPSQLLLQYSDGHMSKKEDGRHREMLNGEPERNRRFPQPSESKISSLAKGSLSSQHHHIHQRDHYETRHMIIPPEYAQENTNLRNSLVLVPNNHNSSSADPGGNLDKLPPPLAPPEKGGICAGKPVSRTPSSTSLPFLPPPLPVDGLKAAVTTLSSHAVIHTTHSATEPMSLGLTSTNFYPAHQPIIGYIAGAGQPQPLSYQTSLPPHLLIPGTQPVIIPVSGAEATATSTTTTFAAALPHAFVTSAASKGESFETPASYPQSTGAVVQAQLHVPILPASTSLPPTPPIPSTPSLPPYFTKGSIIQLADGELKRVEDLKTEDFIQSAEISSELKIDSSTVERIDSSHTPNSAIIQFAVGEHRSQVNVEVLVEYPFFVFGQGWSSCCPDRTTQLLELPCARLAVGDVCISLTLKNLKNGSLKKGQGQNSDSTSLGPPVKPCFKAPSGGTRRAARHTEQENGLAQCGRERGVGSQTSKENGELSFGEKEVCRIPVSTESEFVRKPGGRKRRWSAPEGRKVEKPEEEPPLTLPRPSFIPQEVKISIEGRSNIGK